MSFSAPCGLEHRRSWVGSDTFNRCNLCLIKSTIGSGRGAVQVPRHDWVAHTSHIKPRSYIQGLRSLADPNDAACSRRLERERYSSIEGQQPNDSTPAWHASRSTKSSRPGSCILEYGTSKAGVRNHTQSTCTLAQLLALQLP